VHALGVVVFGKGKVVMSVKPAMVGAAQGGERSKFKHDRLLLMGPIIQQRMIDKKRKNCRIIIYLFDGLFRCSLSLHRLTA
jgi:hypothetical protein